MELPRRYSGTRQPMQETQEMQVQALGREDPLEESLAIHLSVLVRRMARGAWWTAVYGVTKSWT